MTGIGLLGCGSMGSEVATAIVSGKAGDAVLTAAFDQIPEVASALASRLAIGVPFVSDFDTFIKTPGIQMVVECASASAVRDHARQILAMGKDLLIMSSGALADADLYHDLTCCAQRCNCRFIVPSGALGGIDAIRAVRDLLDEVMLTTTKPPRGLQGAPGFADWESKEITKAVVVFEGSALEAVKLFPKNVNVASTLSLAGIGPQRTKVRIIADPKSPGNVHEVFAKGSFGVFNFRMQLQPHPRNPRTSGLAIYAALEALRSACSPGPRIGT